MLTKPKRRYLAYWTGSDYRVLVGTLIGKGTSQRYVTKEGVRILNDEGGETLKKCVDAEVENICSRNGIRKFFNLRPETAADEVMYRFSRLAHLRSRLRKHNLIGTN